MEHAANHSAAAKNAGARTQLEVVAPRSKALQGSTSCQAQPGQHVTFSDRQIGAFMTPARDIYDIVALGAQQTVAL
jgi:hypothetical protein